MMTGFCFDECCDCEVFEDDFDRADTSDLGEAWSEEEGDWSIVTNAVECDAADGVLLHAGVLTEETLDVEVIVNLDTIDDVARLVIGAADADDFYFAQVRVTEDCAFLRLGQMVAGVITWLSEEAAQVEDAGLYGRGEDLRLHVCYANEVLKANVMATTEGAMLGAFQAVEVTLPSSYQIGLATGTQTGTIRFLSFAASKCGTCTQRCFVVNEDFSSGTLGDNWDVRSGTWTAPSTASANAVAISRSYLSTYPESQNSQAQYVHAAIGLEPGAVAMLILAYESDNKYLFATYGLSADGKTETLRIYRRSGGTNTQLATRTARTYVTGQASVNNLLRVCFNGSAMVANLFIGGSLYSTVTAGFVGKQAGIGAFSSSGLVTFGEFYYSILGTTPTWYDSASDPLNPVCPACEAVCADCHVDHPPPPTLRVTIPEGMADGLCNACDQIAGEYTVVSTGACCWEYLGPPLCTRSFTNCTPNPATLRLYIRVCFSVVSGNAQWDCLVQLNSNASCIDPISPANATYRGTTPSTNERCVTPVSTLNLLSDNWGTTCDGTTPTTVGLAL